MKKIIPFLFIVMLLLLLFCGYTYYMQQRDKAKTAESVTYRNIVLNGSNDPVSEADDQSQVSYNSIDEFASKITLQLDEVPIQYLQFDFNQDGSDDVAVAVKKFNEPTVYIVPFELNPLNQAYTRIENIPTDIANAETFSFYDLDVIGERNPALITSGVTANNEQTLKIHLPQMTDNGTVFVEIGSFLADGTITVRRTERSEAYSLGQTYGDSFPVCTQSSDPAAPQSLDQIERLYRWSHENLHYELISETKIPGKNVEARYLSRLRQGSVDDFETFLSGLWYKPESSQNNGIQYLQINTDEREIIFFSNNIQEVYRWDVSSPTRLGLYMTSTNKSVSNLRRLIDVRLAGIDEVTVRIMEDVKMKITVDSTWNGVYRKLGNTTDDLPQDETSHLENIAKLLETTTETMWHTTDGLLLDVKGMEYSFAGRYMESGRLSLKMIQNTSIIFFRNKSTGTTQTYTCVCEPQTLTLVPVTLSARTFETTGETPITFTR